MDFFSFEAALLRLKGALLLQTDKEVAAALGMDASAFNKRKARGSFPVAEVRALALTHNFDPEYVITGVAQAALEVIEAVREGRPFTKVGPEDQQLLAHWHNCSDEDKKLLLLLLKRLSQTPAPIDSDGRYKAREDAPAHVLHDTKPQG